jgi:uncharacterized protein (TIGR03437 family)
MLRITVLFPLLSVAALAGSDYTVVVIPPPSGFTITAAAGINNSGQVAGTSTNGSITQAFVGSPSGSTLIPLPAGWTGSQGAAINASGVVAGDLRGAPPQSIPGAFIGTPSGTTLLPLPPVDGTAYSSALSVNDNNQVGGTAVAFGPFAYLATTSAALTVVGPYPYGGGFGSSQAVNQSGQVAGFEVFAYGSDLPYVYVFFGSPSATVSIPAPPGTLSFAAAQNAFSSTLGLNDVGQIAVTGRAGTQTVYRGVLPPFEIQQAAFGTAAGTAFLPPPPGASGWTSSVGPQSINNSAVVVGVGDSPTRSGGWIWDATNGTRLLTTMVPAGWTVSNAISISNNGLILAQASFQGGASQFVELVPTLPVPVINPTIGVMSARDFGGFASTAPGAFIEIYGSNLASNSRTWAASDFNGLNAPTSLDGTSVTVGGQPAFLSYISPGQVNALVPSSVRTGLQPVVVTSPSGVSASYSVNVNAVEPGLLATPAFNIGGVQYVAALNPDGTYVLPTGAIAGVSSHPAKPGDVIVLYGLGFGPVTPSAAAGQIVQQATSLATNLQMSIGGTTANVDYAGLAPNFTGLYQFDVTVPAIAAGNQPLAFNLGGNAGTQTLFLAVGN